MDTDRSPKKTQEMIYELKVSDAMKKHIITVTPQTLMSEFGTLLREHRISGTPVVDGERLVGIISIEDFINWLKESGDDHPIGRRMSLAVCTVYSDEPLVQAVSKLEQYGYGRIPVLERKTEKLIGIITRGAVIEGLLRELEIDFHEDEIQRYRASHIFSDFKADKTALNLTYYVEGRDISRGGRAASSIKKSLGRMSVHPDICRRAAIAAYEAEMNIIIYAESGEMTCNVEPSRVHLLISDRGPGIPDIQKALEPGYSTAPDWVREMGFGAGMGLNNIQKCADSMDLRSTVGQGTSLDIVFKMEPV